MNILIIKTGALGDVVRTSFIAQALKDKYKKQDPQIFWLTDEKAKPFFSNNPYIQKIGSLEQKQNLRKYSFDLIVNLEEDQELVKFVSSLDYKKFLGFIWKNKKVSPTQTTKEFFNMSLLGKKPQNDILKVKCKKTHRQLMGEIIEVDWKKYEPFLRLSNSQIELSNKFSKRYNLSKNEIVIGLVIGGADRWPKSLPINLSTKLIDLIYKKLKCKIILFGGPNEIDRNKQIIAKSNSPVIDAGTGNNLTDFPALLNVCNYVIATDTLGLHLSLALKKKTICLIGPTPPNEKDMYGFGKKIIAKSKCVACLKKDCKSMQKIHVKEVVKELQKLAKQPVLDIIITAYKEPKIARAIKSILNQKIDYKFNLIVSAPDKETCAIVKKFTKDKRVRLFKDPGKGKNLAMNMLLPKLKGDILIFTDGDVYLGKEAINHITRIFDDSTIGCATGRPVPEETRHTKYGYWANFLFEQAHKMRKQTFLNNDFLECSGYLFAFRNNVVDSFPLDTAEDTVIPYFFWEKGYRIGYADKAEVYVKNVNNWKDWIKQKTRISKGHETIDKYVNTKITPRTKTFKNEAKGATALITYPQNSSEALWSINLMFARLYMWLKTFFEIKIKGQQHQDGWERVGSTK